MLGNKKLPLNTEGVLRVVGHLHGAPLLSAAMAHFRGEMVVKTQAPLHTGKVSLSRIYERRSRVHFRNGHTYLLRNTPWPPVRSYRHHSSITPGDKVLLSQAVKPEIEAKRFFPDPGKRHVQAQFLTIADRFKKIAGR
jgi:hypothetical protein